MRVVVFLALLLPTLAASAFAFPESAAVFSGDPVNLPDLRDDIYAQQPSTSWGVYNASTSFGSEMADDIPSSLAYASTGGVTFYVGEWGGAMWQPFTSLIVNFYNESCPPNQDPDYHFVVPYSNLSAQQVYGGSWYVYQCTAYLNENVAISPSMSLGGLVDQDWGQNPPYCGLAICDVVFYGCELFWDAEYWGYSRWIPASLYFGVEVDLAYALGQAVIDPPEEEACCFDDGRCLYIYDWWCTEAGGFPQGYDTDCEPNPCSPTATVPDEPQSVSHVSWGEVRGLYR